MDAKETFINSVTLKMQSTLDCHDLSILQNALSDLLADYDLAPRRDLPSTDVADNIEILKHFLTAKKIEGLSQNTLKLYLYHINKFFNHSRQDIKTADTNDIRRYLGHLGINGSNSYVDDARRILNSFFTFCENEEYIIRNPCRKISRIKQEKKMEKPYSDMEIELLREACVTLREKALVSFLLSTGCRRDEVRKIRVADIDFGERSVLIHGKGGKDRVVYFSAKCELCLKDYLKSRAIKSSSEYLFCSERKPYGQLSNGGLARIAKGIGRRANVGNVHLHRFRKWFGTHMADRGVLLQDLKEMMGHSKLDTTNTYYVYANTDRIRTAHKRNAV